MALFGAPIAHEDHAQRACYAALRLRDELRRYADELQRDKGLAFSVRMGLNSGEVVVGKIGDDLRMEWTAQGHTVGLAARMEQFAEPGTACLSQHTAKLVEGFFELRDLGKLDVKGVREPVHVYELEGAGPLRTPLEVSARRGLVRFVGRRPELERLHRAWGAARAGRGQIAAVVGEPGVGKSRLVHEFKGSLERGCRVLEAFAVSHGKASAYLPLIELLKGYFGIALEDDERERREKVTAKLLALDEALEATLPYLFSLLDVADEATSLAQMDPEIRRRRTLQAVKRVLVRETLEQPCVLIFEDLHWIDAETQAFLEVLSESVATARLLLLFAYRPEYRHAWGSKTYYMHLRLDPLGEQETRELLATLLGEGASAERETLERLVLEKTEGNPFFLEEVVKTLAEEGVLAGERGRYRLERSPDELHIPATVQSALAARIDRLPAQQKDLLQTLAVIGKEFPLGLVRSVTARGDEDLYRGLSQLQAGEFIYEQPAFPEPEYRFKHALTRDVAYESQLASSRRQVHGVVAQALEELHADSLSEQAPLLAHHFDAAGLTRPAVAYYRSAGERAMERSAHPEAVAHLTRGLELIETLPESPERAREELALQLALGPALGAIKGPSSSEAQQAYTRAQRLCQQAGEVPELIMAQWGLWRVHERRGEFETAQDYADQIFRAAESVREPALLLQAHHAQWTTRFALGQLRLVREHSECGIGIYRREEHHAQTFAYGGHDPGVCARAFASWSLWLLGSPDQALERSREAVELAESLSHPFSRGLSLRARALCEQLRRDARGAREAAEAMISASNEDEFPYFPPFATSIRGWALTRQGRYEEGIALMREGVSDLSEAMFVIYFLVLLAEACGTAGAAEDALRALDEARDRIRSFGGHFYEAELHRVRGDLLLQSGGQGGESEAAFRLAVETARRQGAKSLELRAATSLARSQQRQRREAEARALLAPVYDGFTEGFDTRDLTDAKALLAELA